MTSTHDSCKEGASKSNDVCSDIEKLQTTSAADNNDDVNVSVCANCGKKGSYNDMNTCNKCKMVKYCNAACKKKHRSKHKKQCDRRVAELHDEKLFKRPPSQHGDCPICFLRLPTLESGYRYYGCCGKVICSGCVYAPVYDNQGNEVDYKKCPFCRVPTPVGKKEMIKREKERAELDDPIAIYNLGWNYSRGEGGLPQDLAKALELYHRAGELGDAKAYNSVGNTYHYGRGVEVDKEKAIHYWELAAMKGSVTARHNLGCKEGIVGNYNRALKHFMIAARNGLTDSLEAIKQMYSKGHVTKEVYTKALQSYQEYLGEIKSVQRDKVAASRDDCPYY